MIDPESLLRGLRTVVPVAVTAAWVVAVLLAAHWFLLRRHRELRNERRFPRQLAMLGLTLLGIVAVTLALPVEPSSRNQILALLGLLASGVFAFSSTTLFANLTAGVMLRMTRAFRTGDFITVGDVFGRVSERGLFDTEIQTESRELVSLPNTFVVTHPVSVVRASGTIVSASLSLGYDLHHSRIERLLAKAAEKCGLQEPFVRILELGDFAVTYRVSGLLQEVNNLLTTRSHLNRSVLDVLHGDGVEIVSPAFMNQRRIDDATRFVPEPVIERPAEVEPVPEAIVFDKAERAAKLEHERKAARNELGELEVSLKEAKGDEHKRIAEAIGAAKARLEALDAQKAEADAKD